MILLVPNATSMSTIEVSMNSRNASNLGSSSTSRSTFLHTTSLKRSWIPTSRSPEVSFAHTCGLTGSPHSKMLRYRCLNQSVQTEDGHTMMKFDTFSLIPELEPRTAWISSLCAVAESGTERETNDNCRPMRARITTRAYVSPKTGREVTS